MQTKGSSTVKNITVRNISGEYDLDKAGDVTELSTEGHFKSKTDSSKVTLTSEVIEADKSNAKKLIDKGIKEVQDFELN